MEKGRRKDRWCQGILRVRYSDVRDKEHTGLSPTRENFGVPAVQYYRRALTVIITSTVDEQKGALVGGKYCTIRS
jgi:hypothetical protein